MATFCSVEWKFGDRARTAFNPTQHGLLEAQNHADTQKNTDVYENRSLITASQFGA
jgi:hypothetical protein